MCQVFNALEIDLTLWQRETRGLPPLRHDWTIIHSFFVGMGGYVIDMDLGGEMGESNASPHLALTAKGVLRLASLGYELPDVPLQSIKDRSKADTFTKSIAGLQAGYLVVQLIGRLASGLFITLLEINAFGHALCALIIFWFWLKKPYDIKSPIPVAEPWVEPVAALWSLEMGCAIQDCSHEMNTRIMRPWRAREHFEHFIRTIKKRVKPRAVTNTTGLRAHIHCEAGENGQGNIEKVNPGHSKGNLSR